jgi:hypothetical protein
MALPGSTVVNGLRSIGAEERQALAKVTHEQSHALWGIYSSGSSPAHTAVSRDPATDRMTCSA